jgi:hypothetical protein
MSALNRLQAPATHRDALPLVSRSVLVAVIPNPVAPFANGGEGSAVRPDWGLDTKGCHVRHDLFFEAAVSIFQI